MPKMHALRRLEQAEETLTELQIWLKEQKTFASGCGWRTNTPWVGLRRNGAEMAEKFEWVVYKKGRSDQDLHFFDRFESEAQAKTWLNFLKPVQRLNFVIKRERVGHV